MFTRIKAALGWSASGNGAKVQAVDGTVWRTLGEREADAFASEFGKLAALADSPGASEAPDVADRWLTDFSERRQGTLESAPSAARLLRKLGRTDELAVLQADYPKPAGQLAGQVTAAGALGIAKEVVAEPDMPAEAVAATAVDLQRMLDTYEFRGREAGPHKESVRHALAVARLRQNRPHEVPSLCVRELARKNLSDTERATVLATLAMARQQLGQPYQELIEQARSLDPDADLVAEAMERAAVAASAIPVWPLW
jgi:hypothetical protein